MLNHIVLFMNKINMNGRFFLVITDMLLLCKKILILTREFHTNAIQIKKKGIQFLPGKVNHSSHWRDGRKKLVFSCVSGEACLHKL